MIQNWKSKSKGTQVLKTRRRENDPIYYVLIDEPSQSVFEGSKSSILFQVDLRSQKTTKKYSGLGVGSISCLSSFENLLFIGGYNYCFTLINISERRVLTVKPVKVPFDFIHCCLFTIINHNNNPTVVLTVSEGKC